MQLDTHRLQTLGQVREFLDGSQEIDLRPQTRTEAYAFVAETVQRFDYAGRSKADKGRPRFGERTDFRRSGTADLPVPRSIDRIVGGGQALSPRTARDHEAQPLRRCHGSGHRESPRCGRTDRGRGAAGLSGQHRRTPRARRSPRPATPGMTSAWVFSVSVICEWPSVSMMIRGSAPWASSSVTAVCRRSWYRMSGSSAERSIALKVLWSRPRSTAVPPNPPS